MDRNVFLVGRDKGLHLYFRANFMWCLVDYVQWRFEGLWIAGTFRPRVLDAEAQLSIAREANQARLVAKPVRLIERVRLLNHLPC